MDIIIAVSKLTAFAQILIICSVYYLLKYTLVAIRIAIRGWPPEHLDVDGDWKSEKKED